MLNVLYVSAGSAGVNGVFIITGVLVLCAWRVAGHLCGDRIIIYCHARRQDRVRRPRRTPASSGALI